MRVVLHQLGERRRETARRQVVVRGVRLNDLVGKRFLVGSVECLGAGYFNPLTGYMNLADSLSIAEKLQTTSGLFWPVPIVKGLAAAAGAGTGSALAMFWGVRL